MMSAIDRRLNLDIVRKWQTDKNGLELMLLTLDGQNLFRKFLQNNLCAETLNFYLAVENLKRETDEDAMKRKCRVIYENFVVEEAVHQVTLIKYGIRSDIEKHIAAPHRNMYEKAQQEQREYMESRLCDFFKSKLYKNFLIRVEEMEDQGRY